MNTPLNPPLRLNLHRAEHRITIQAIGQLTALTAHRLLEAVTGTLRRHTIPTMAIDLTGITAIDDVGEIALQQCECEAARRGVLLTIDRPRPDRQQPQARRSAWIGRPIPNTGAVCRNRIPSQ